MGIGTASFKKRRVVLARGYREEEEEGGDNACGSMMVARRHDGSTTLPITWHCSVALYFCVVMSSIYAEHRMMYL